MDETNPDIHQQSVDFIRLRRFMQTFRLFLPYGGSVAANPMLTRKEHVMFLPDIAWRQADGSVAASAQAWVYRQQKRRGITRLLAFFLGINIAALGEAERRRFYARTQLFRVGSLRGKHLYINDACGQQHFLPRTSSNGRSGRQITLDHSLIEQDRCQKLSFRLDTCSGSPAGTNAGMLFYAPPKGISIISDMDDTIKETSVGKTRQMLTKTFLEDFTPVEGMCAWYRHLASHGNVAFHYVSGSPIQLYPALREFMQRLDFPEGSMHLHEATRWTGAIPRSRASRKAHKKRAIERLLRAYPQRSFILIGDSGENDPAVYADIMACYPHQVRYILIRDITPHIKPQFYEAIFRKVARDKWLVTPDVSRMHAFVQLDKNRQML